MEEKDCRAARSLTKQRMQNCGYKLLVCISCQIVCHKAVGSEHANLAIAQKCNEKALSK